MFRPLRISLCLILITLSSAELMPRRCEAEHLWEKRDHGRAFLFYDSKARNIGDTVTVFISQSTDVNNREGRRMNKATSAKGTVDLAGASEGGFAEQGGSASLEFGSTSDRKFDGASTYTTAQVFTDQMACTVMDVLPNGNLVISGTRRVRVTGEEKTLVLSGIIRAVDLGPDNNISSQYISQFTLDYQSGGKSQRFTKQNWLGRTVNVVWPW